MTPPRGLNDPPAERRAASSAAERLHTRWTARGSARVGVECASDGRGCSCGVVVTTPALRSHAAVTTATAATAATTAATASRGERRAQPTATHTAAAA